MSEWEVEAESFIWEGASALSKPCVDFRRRPPTLVVLGPRRGTMAPSGAAVATTSVVLLPTVIHTRTALAAGGASSDMWMVMSHALPYRGRLMDDSGSEGLEPLGRHRNDGRKISACCSQLSEIRACLLPS